MSTSSNSARAPLGLKITLLGLVLAALMGFGVAAAQAAAPTLEPVINSSPADPNNTSKTNTFNVTKDPSETEAITQIQCRFDPNVGTPWSYCLGAAGGNYNLQNLTNGLHEVQFRTLNADGSGPAVSLTWTVATPVPTLPPNITVQPEDPNTTATQNQIKQAIDASESAIATGMQCSFDGSDWSTCGATVNYYPGNGTHTFHSRVYNTAGTGPESTVTWTNDIPEDIPGALQVDDLATTRWDGPAANSTIGANAPGASSGMNVGDINGDGINDLGIADSLKGVQVLFNSGKGLGARTMSGLGPNQGYLIEVGGGAMYPNIGDQNDDGIPDLLIFSSDDYNSAYVVYGVSDPSDLDPCVPGEAARCLDATAMTSDQGYKISSSTEMSVATSAGDFDGDGIKDISIGSEDGLYLLKGGVSRSGTVDLQGQVGTDALKITGPTGIQFGAFGGGIDDLNGDGKDEVAVLGGLFSGGGLYVITGRSLEGAATIDVTTFSSSDGFFIAAAPLGLPQATNVGDMNGDGRDDLMVAYINLGAATAGEVSIIYMPELPTSAPLLTGDDLEAGAGYVIKPGDAPAAFGLGQANLGDINGDGLSDQFLGANASNSNGFDKSGAAYIAFGRDPEVESPIEFGPSFLPEDGLAIVSGKVRSGQFGDSPTLMGDTDGDGLPDFAVAADGEGNNGFSRSGSVYLIPGSSLMAQATTAGSTVISDTAAKINGQVSTNGRDTDYQFEYGTTDQYGSATDSESLPAGGTVPVNAALSGLTPKTEYHYRLVVTNALGLTRYGEDHTFTTEATPPPEGCEADSTLPGCPDYDYCKANPNEAACAAPTAKLSGLIVNVGASKVKRGKKTVAKATIVNTGTAAAEGVKVCLKAPKKFIGGARCVNVGSLGAGATKTTKFMVKVKRKAKKGKKVTLKFKATASGLGAKTGKANIRIG